MTPEKDFGNKIGPPVFILIILFMGINVSLGIVHTKWNSVFKNIS